MERSSKRGKIPQQDWPSIIKRYEAGETLASIARTYDCSPPAISYILSRSRARDATAEGTEQSGIETAEPQFIKGHSKDMPAREFINGTPEIGEAVALTTGARASSPIDVSDPDPVPVAPGSAPNGTAGASEKRAETAAMEVPEDPAQREFETPAQAAPAGSENSSGALDAAGPQPPPAEVPPHSSPLAVAKRCSTYGNPEPWRARPRFSRRFGAGGEPTTRIDPASRPASPGPRCSAQ